MLDGSHYYKTFLDERPTLSSLQPPVLARLEAEFAGIFNREERTLFRQILSTQGKTQLGLR